MARALLKGSAMNALAMNLVEHSAPRPIPLPSPAVESDPNIAVRVPVAESSGVIRIERVGIHAIRSTDSSFRW